MGVGAADPRPACKPAARSRLEHNWMPQAKHALSVTRPASVRGMDPANSRVSTFYRNQPRGHCCDRGGSVMENENWILLHWLGWRCSGWLIASVPCS